MKDTPGMWNRCISAAPRVSWSGFTPQGPSSSTYGPTQCPLRPLFSLSALNLPRSPVEPTSTWTGWGNFECSSVKKIRPRGKCIVSASRRGHFSSRPCLKGTSAEKSHPFSTSWLTTDQEQIHIHCLVRVYGVVFNLQNWQNKIDKIINKDTLWWFHCGL